MKLLKAIPVLPAKNMGETINFYECKLGFKGFNFGNYAIIKSGMAEIHFSIYQNIIFQPATSVNKFLVQNQLG